MACLVGVSTSFVFDVWTSYSDENIPAGSGKGGKGCTSYEPFWGCEGEPVFDCDYFLLGLLILLR